ncbi:MAG: glycosyltransferase family 39 protein [Anaerolineae bacterium]|nr:glycosyltransferase family 39 protein [Anaerolineae bacterium]
MATYHRRNGWALLVLGLAYILRLYHLDFQSIWWDEGHSIYVATHPVAQIPPLPAMDVHPPAYFTLLHLWLSLAGNSEFALRYLSVLFSLLTVALLWRFAASIHLSHTFPSAPLLATLLAALSPMYVAYAQEVRSYAMMTFLAAASTFILWWLLFPGPNRDTRQKRGILLGLYIIVTALCLYTHYFTLFLLIFHNLVWLAWLLGEKVSLKHSRAIFITHAGLWLASQAGILLLFAPQLQLALRQITSYTNPNLIPPTLSYFITQSWQAYTTGLTISPTPARWGMVAIAGGLLVSWGIHFWQNPVKLITPFAFLLAWLLIPLAAYFIALQRQPSFEPRYLMLVTPALFLLLAVGLGRGTRGRWQGLRLIYYVLLAIPLLVFIIGLRSYYINESYFKDDSAGVADWLVAETTANDVVYIDVPHPFHYYQNRIPAPTRYLFVDIHTAADTLTREAAGRDRLFWVTWHGSDTDPRGVIPFLAEKAGQQLGQLDFRGYRVEWFDLPDTGVVFSLPAVLTPINATFGDVLRLDGVAYGETTTVADPTWATLYFTLLHNTEVDYKVSVRVRGEEGRVVAQVDKDLLNDRHFRTSAWPIADPFLNQVINVYTLPLVADTPPGLYQLEVVVYNSQPPYPAEGVTGHKSPDGVAAMIGRITVIP